MRVLVTVVREGSAPQDVLVLAEEGAEVADVAGALASAVPSRRPAEPGAPRSVVVPLTGPRPGPSGPHSSRTGPPGSSRPGASGPGPSRPDPSGPGPSDGHLWVDGRRCDPRAPAAAVLTDGARLTLDDTIGPFLREGEPTGRFELRVAGGPGSGRVLRLGAGVTTLGSGPACTLRVADPELPPLAARVTVDIHGGLTLAAAPGADCSLGDAPVDADRDWPPGAVLRAGDSLFVLDVPADADAHLTPMHEGGLAYHRPPRLTPVRPRPRLVVPAPPGRADRARFQLIAAFLPVLFGLVMYGVTGQAYMLLFCLMSPVMMVGQWLSDHREGKKRNKTSLRRYKKELAAHEAEVARLGKEEQRLRRRDHPDPAEVLLFATGPRRRLWERRLTDPDTLRLRLGVAALPADIELVADRGAPHDDQAPHPPSLPDVPATVSFPRLGVVGVAGDRHRALATARWLAVQSAVLHSPRDLSVVVLAATRRAGDDWGWAHWLPHTRPQRGQDCAALVGSDAEAVGRRVHELLTELHRRKAARESHRASGTLRPDPHVLLVLDGARLLRRVAGMPELLQDGPEHGIFALCLDEDERLLPEECRAAVRWPLGAATRLVVRGAGLERVGEVVADQVGAEWCELIARSLAPVRDVSRDDADGALPGEARLLSLLELPDPTGVDIAHRWRSGGATTEAAVGVAADGPFLLDIRRDGPHALIAGTTGSGKSELLQTLIASLAVANRPDALNFVLIDYKGGSAFMDCARLPHTVGMVSDLDAHLTERALASLAAELRRREEILLAAGAKDLEDYVDTRALRPELPPLPRLVLIIDEFASLVAELPDFIDGLVDIARRGRSLGVHLVLATQRPAGVVSADIRANTNLRIALRVTDGAESADVLDAPDAGAIARSTPGRAYVRSGAQSLVAVQSARIGGRRPRTGATGPRARLVPLDGPAYGRPLPRVADAEDDGTMVTDLAVLVDAVRDAAARTGAPPPRSPWLPPLPDRLTLDEAPRPDAAADEDVPPVPFGVTDLPSQQRRAPFVLDLVRGEHVLIVGGARSGRSTALRTLAGSLARTAAPYDVHVHGIDCGSNVLAPLAALPHAGAVVTRDQPDRVRRLLDRLLAEIARRQQILATGGAAGAAEQRAGAAGEERLPWLVLLLDGWEGFTQAFEDYNYGQLVDAAQRIFREGPAVGLKVVMTADRSGLSGQVASLFAERLVLRMTDPGDYATAGFGARDVPKEMPNGRALRLTDGGAEETQLALLAPDPSGQAQVRALRELADAARRAHPRQPPARLRPLRVDALPRRITARECDALVPGFVPPSPLWALLAVGGDELRPVGVDLEADGPGFVIAGPPKSGRSTALVTAARSLLRAKTPVVLVTPRRSPLRALAGAPGVLGLLRGTDATEDELTELVEKADGRPYVALVDDAELLHESLLDEALEQLVRSGMDGGHGLVAAGATDGLSSQYRGFVVSARSAQQGLLLAPRSAQDGELFHVRLPANAGAGPVGSGLYVSGGAFRPVQCVVDGPDPDEAAAGTPPS
ncbi:FtsK/SpoIIIE domain-containing protein [Streptomyces sp. NBC_01525]|uniref:FtsK/SpoIIIE domain-containing protein n=1 Tax=Streptomyces sp. NBC_01525 TaxID=2903893 RepID=UPI003864C087